MLSKSKLYYTHELCKAKKKIRSSPQTSQQSHLRRLQRTRSHLYSPTYQGASLDFGVFLCSSCSGAHRALGPTITRVKSTHLDLWEEEWYRNMVIGNEKLNKYW